MNKLVFVPKDFKNCEQIIRGFLKIGWYIRRKETSLSVFFFSFFEVVLFEHFFLTTKDFYFIERTLRREVFFYEKKSVRIDT